MAVRLLTVESSYKGEDGLHVLPGIPAEEMSRHEETRRMMSNGPVELRLPDGMRRQTRLVRFGVSVFRGDDGSFQVAGDESGPKFTMLFTLSADLQPEDVPPGTEIWVVEAERAEGG